MAQSRRVEAGNWASDTCSVYVANLQLFFAQGLEMKGATGAATPPINASHRS
jgi:hypothetical protein